jgi:DtxR family Mn-dependent transcriptional regulator
MPNIIIDNSKKITVALAGKSKVARSRDIARLLGVSGASVNVALTNLSKDESVIYGRYSYAELASRGERLAQSIQGRRDTLFKFLTEILGIVRKIPTEVRSI